MGSCFLRGNKPILPNPNCENQLARKASSVLMTPEQLEKFKNQGENSVTPTIRFPSQGKPQQGSLFIINKKIVQEGILTECKQQGFEEKRMSFSHEDANSEILSSMGIAATCKKGLKPNCPNQDDYFVAIDEKTVLLGVFDGHGPFGHDISNFVHQNLPNLIANHPSWETNSELALKEAFNKCHTSLIEISESASSHIDCSISGTTATLAYLSNQQLYIAHVGDSRAVIASFKDNTLIARNLTIDHRPDLPSEIERIKQSGGEVRRLTEDSPCRIFFPGENYPGLNMSRSFGDKISRRLGVISEPDVASLTIENEDLFLLICSDGVWEFITSQEAVSLIHRSERNAKKASEKLAALAWMRWKQRFSSLVDDITVILVYFNKPLTE